MEEWINDIIIEQTPIFQLKIKTLDNVIFNVPFYWKKYSTLINSFSMLCEGVINIEYDSNILNKVINFIDLYENIRFNIAVPIKSSIDKIIPKPYVTYLENFTMDELYDTVNLAGYLNIELLLELLTAFIASMLYDNNPKELEKIFDLESDLTEEMAETLVKELQHMDK